jgi:hypothetical protein
MVNEGRFYSAMRKDFSSGHQIILKMIPAYAVFRTVLHQKKVPYDDLFCPKITPGKLIQIVLKSYHKQPHRALPAPFFALS